MLIVDMRDDMAVLATLHVGTR
uniref:Uncharacterized protein n=1 Tax=Ralstonia solanacearum TaxID=305 RepID=A0A0S4TN61_RALSL|nr:protein of unknown function [Ralstonia solanacearum]